MKKRTLALVAALMAGCGEEQAQQQVSAPPLFTVDTQDELVLKSLPTIRQACPGLNKYAADFENARVEQQYRTSIVFHIPERSSIPDAYKASGHNCFIEIEGDGSSAFIEKQACKSVCLDQVGTPYGQLKLTIAPQT